MSDWVVDTNVPIVANGRAEAGEPRAPSLECRRSAVQFLIFMLSTNTTLLDQEGAILSEYRNHLRPSGEPGVGDRFYQALLQSSPARVRRVSLQKDARGEYDSFPDRLAEISFDPSDRKFVALSIQEDASIANAVDSDWINAQTELIACGVTVVNLCGCDPARWFTTSVP